MKLDNKELLERLSTSRRAFNATAFTELDRNLSDDEREEWNAIYASFSSRSLLRNTVIGLESIPFPTDDEPEQVLTCMVVMRHLVKVLIPLPLFWIEPTGINPNKRNRRGRGLYHHWRRPRGRVCNRGSFVGLGAAAVARTECSTRFRRRCGIRICAGLRTDTHYDHGLWF